MLTVTEGDLGDGDRADLFERQLEKAIRLPTELFGFHVVRALEVEAARDLTGGHELGDGDGPGRGQWQLVKVGVVDDDIAVSRDLVALLHVREGDLVVPDITPPLVADWCLVVAAELSKRRSVGLGGHVETNGNADQPETYDAAPHGARHDPDFILRANRAHASAIWQGRAGASRSCTAGAPFLTAGRWLLQH
jgi:hypothetical protein